MEFIAAAALVAEKNRDAAHTWEMEYAEMMVEAGFKQGSCSARVLYHEEKNLRVLLKEMTSQYLGQAKVWIGYAQLCKIGWR